MRRRLLPLNNQCFAMMHVRHFIYHDVKSSRGAPHVRVDKVIQEELSLFPSSVYLSIDEMPDSIEDTESIYHLIELPCEAVQRRPWSELEDLYMQMFGGDSVESE